MHNRPITLRCVLLVAALLVLLSGFAPAQSQDISTVKGLVKQAGFEILKEDISDGNPFLLFMVEVDGEKVPFAIRKLYNEDMEQSLYVFMGISAVSPGKYTEETRYKFLSALCVMNNYVLFGAWAYEEENDLLTLDHTFFAEKVENMSADEFQEICEMMSSTVVLINSNINKLLSMLEGVGEEGLGFTGGGQRGMEAVAKKMRELTGSVLPSIPSDLLKR